MIETLVLSVGPILLQLRLMLMRQYYFHIPQVATWLQWVLDNASDVLVAPKVMALTMYILLRVCMLCAWYLYSCTAHLAIDCKVLRLSGWQLGPVEVGALLFIIKMIDFSNQCLFYTNWCLQPSHIILCREVQIAYFTYTSFSGHKITSGKIIIKPWNFVFLLWTPPVCMCGG